MKRSGKLRPGRQAGFPIVRLKQTPERRTKRRSGVGATRVGPEGDFQPNVVLPQVSDADDRLVQHSVSGSGRFPYSRDLAEVDLKADPGDELAAPNRARRGEVVLRIPRSHRDHRHTRRPDDPALRRLPREWLAALAISVQQDRKPLLYTTSPQARPLVVHLGTDLEQGALVEADPWRRSPARSLMHRSQNVERE